MKLVAKRVCDTIELSSPDNQTDCNVYHRLEMIEVDNTHRMIIVMTTLNKSTNNIFGLGIFFKTLYQLDHLMFLLDLHTNAKNYSYKFWSNW